MAGDDDREAHIRAACDRGDAQTAATLTIEGYGPQILGFLFTLLDDEDDAHDVFSVYCEDVWRGLPSFQGRCSVRAWCYTLARHAAMRFLRSGPRRAHRHIPLSQSSQVARLAERVRSETVPAHQRSEVKNQVRRLREKLTVDEQILLVLRVDRDLSWTDVATVLAGKSLDGAALERQAAAARKRFQVVKEKLRRMAREAGLL